MLDPNQSHLDENASIASVPKGENELTTKEFWRQHWLNRKNLIKLISENNIHAPVFAKYISDSTYATLEIGGFPGYFLLYLMRRYNIEGTLFDFVIIEDIIRRLADKNGIDQKRLNIIEGDIFEMKANPMYDLVYSIGFIEHFRDTKDIIQRHIEQLKPKGQMLIILPNFRGINGWIQKIFDRDNYEKHYLQCMETGYLKSITEQAGMENCESYYFGRFSVWLEDKHNKSLFAVSFVNVVWFIGKVLFKILPFESKMFSPYLVLAANKAKN